MFNIGDKVVIHSRFHGIYNNRTGTVTDNARSDGFIKVKFDEPIRYESTVFVEEIFYPNELQKI